MGGGLIEKNLDKERKGDTDAGPEAVCGMESPQVLRNFIKQREGGSIPPNRSCEQDRPTDDLNNDHNIIYLLV